MRILVFTTDILPYPGLPTTGGGLRSWQIVRSLEHLGHDVVASMPTFTFLAKRFAGQTPAEIRDRSWSVGGQDALVERFRPDAVVFTSSWVADNLQKRHDILHLYDLDGPVVLESLYRGAGAPQDLIRLKIEKLTKADFVFCGGQRQRSYFLPFLMQAGFSLADLDAFPVVPVAIADVAPPLERSEEIEFVAGGGFYPWQNPYPALAAALRVITQAPVGKARLRVFGGFHPGIGAGESEFRAFQNQWRDKPNVSFHGFCSREDWLAQHRSASVAIEVHERNRERELAVTTRTIDYLWRGIPVLYNAYSELSETISRHNAGWLIGTNTIGEMEERVSQILSDPGILAEKSANTQKLTASEHDWIAAADPLRKFLTNPRRRSAPSPTPPRFVWSTNWLRKLFSP